MNESAVKNNSSTASVDPSLSDLYGKDSVKTRKAE